MTDQAVPALSATGVCKSFGALKANDDVSLAVYTGEVHAVVGENGAGKTTLMRMLSGEIQPDSGTIAIDGNPVTFRNPQEAVTAGIGMVHQHYSVISEFTVLDNLLFGVPGSSAKPLRRDERERAIAFLEEEGFAQPDRTAVRELAVDELQRFEIAKLLYVGARILILDEPTAVLGPIEIERLYARLHDLADKGRAIVVITHKLAEVEAHAQRVTVMRGGRTVLTAEGSQGKASLLPAMFGDHMAVAKEQDALQPYVPLGSDEVVLTVDGLNVHGHDGRLRVDDASFDVRRGEVLCVIGVEGNGQPYLMDALAGLRDSAGSVRIGSDDVSRLSPRDRFHHGIRFVSEDRHRWDVLRDASVAENMLAHDYADGRALGFTNPRDKGAVDTMVDVMRKFDVRPLAPRLRLGKLSGGNQQRAVVARESAGEKKVLLMSHPTRGLDVVGSAKIIEDVREQQARGVAVVWNTADIDEAFSVADTILVMFQGRVAYLGPTSTTSHDQVAAAMSGTAVA